MAALGRLIGQLYKDFGKPAVDEVLSVLGRDADPEMVKKAVAQRAPAKPAAKVAPKPPAKVPAMAVKPQTLPAPEAPLAVKPQGITAYHGSPHSFDRFDISKIGTGEGAQAFGHGLYFAENEGVARSYRDALARPFYETANGDNVAEKYGSDVVAAFDSVGGDPAEIQATVERLRKTVARDLQEFGVRSVADLRPQYDGDLASTVISASRRADGLEALLKSGDVKMAGEGSMYQVRIDADPADFLDWDAPLSGQSEKVRAGVDAVARFTQRERETLPVRNALEIMGSAGEASAKLREAGIPGIKYLDQGSRTAGDGSRNYVVFDDKLISILKKYGWAPGMAIPAAAMEEYEAEQELARGGFAVR